MHVKPPATSRRPSLKDVADALGVTAATVSNAYNRPNQLSPALRDRVLEKARLLGYPGPNPIARGLRRGRTGAIGVLYADRLSYAFKDPVAVELLAGIATATEAAPQIRHSQTALSRAIGAQGSMRRVWHRWPVMPIDAPVAPA